MELEETSGEFEPLVDRRPRMVPPPPVRLVAVEDVRLEARVGQETELDDFYVKLLRFDRLIEEDRPVYEAENFCIRFDWIEGPIAREDFRMLGIAIPSLAEAENKIAEAKIEYMRQRGLQPGQETLVLQDPSGNWVQLVEYRMVG
jgi:hypothetical protein